MYFDKLASQIQQWNGRIPATLLYPGFDPPNPRVALPLLPSQLTAAGSSSSLSYSFIATAAARTSLSLSSSSSSHLALLSSVPTQRHVPGLRRPHSVTHYGSGSWSTLLLSPRCCLEQGGDHLELLDCKWGKGRSA